VPPEPLGAALAAARNGVSVPLAWNVVEPEEGAYNWAPFDATKKSYDLFARHVLPKFNGANRGREGSLRWVAEHSGEFMGAAVNAAMATIQKHAAEAGNKD